jgi:Reverse transcriptase (RNA-dependent DNA polymerase)
MYGLVQAARQWLRNFISILVEEFKLKQRQADACVLTRKDEHGVIILCIYVDDALIVGDQAAIEMTVALFKTKVSLKDVGPLAVYVGCTVVKDPYKQKLWMWQPDHQDGRDFQETHPKIEDLQNTCNSWPNHFQE